MRNAPFFNTGPPRNAIEFLSRDTKNAKYIRVNNNFSYSSPFGSSREERTGISSQVREENLEALNIRIKRLCQNGKFWHGLSGVLELIKCKALRVRATGVYLRK